MVGLNILVVLENPVQTLSVLDFIHVLALALLEAKDATLHTVGHKTKCIVFLLLLVRLYH